ncbi:MAG: hypothetical protein IPI35_35540 [Deltaproteobacteria bacterium]|nr:hypothetical protein [Deltaproteobacteria bacterium]
MESPTLVDWERCWRAPRWQPRPDVYLTHGLGDRPVWLYEPSSAITASSRPLFDGGANPVLGGLNLDHIAQPPRARYPDRVRPLLVVPSATQPEALTWDGEVLYDVDQLRTAATPHRASVSTPCGPTRSSGFAPSLRTGRS